MLTLGRFVSWNDNSMDLSDNDRATIGGITIESPQIGVNLRQVLNEEFYRVLNQHGAKAFESPKTSAAIHEAGHVVVHTVNGTRVKRSRIREAAPGN
jgi:hypothetical protein